MTYEEPDSVFPRNRGKDAMRKFTDEEFEAELAKIAKHLGAGPAVDRHNMAYENVVRGDDKEIGQ